MLVVDRGYYQPKYGHPNVVVFFQIRQIQQQYEQQDYIDTTLIQYISC